jgi:cholera toxin transcriptional activator
VFKSAQCTAGHFSAIVSQSITARKPSTCLNTSFTIRNRLSWGAHSLPDSDSQNRVYRFGVYEFDGSTGELRKDGKLRPRVPGQPLEVLLILLERCGDVVTREEFRRRLWPADTFVDYDHSLNAAVNKLRESLNDSAENPRFIQTIPRRGYRFIGSAEIVNDVEALRPAVSPPISHSSTHSTVPTPGAGGEGSPSNRFTEEFSVLSEAHDLPAVRRGTIKILFSLLQIMYLSFYVFSLVKLRAVEFVLAQMWDHSAWVFALILVTAMVGIPIRLYLLTAAIFGYRGLTGRFLTMFPALFPLDELWALSPFLIANRIGIGLALAATAALLYLPFSQRSLLLMDTAKTQ